jgi:copper chaperone CopZ
VSRRLGELLETGPGGALGDGKKLRARRRFSSSYSRCAQLVTICFLFIRVFLFLISHVLEKRFRSPWSGHSSAPKPGRFPLVITPTFVIHRSIGRVLCSSCQHPHTHTHDVCPLQPSDRESLNTRHPPHGTDPLISKPFFSAGPFPPLLGGRFWFWSVQSLLCSLQREEEMGDAAKYQKSYFDVLGICCTTEVPVIEKLLSPLPGVRKVSVIVPSRTVIVVHDADAISPAQIGKFHSSHSLLLPPS